MSSEEVSKVELDQELVHTEETSVEKICPKLTKPWFFYPRLLQLNFLLIGGLLCQIVCGYDVSKTTANRTPPPTPPVITMRMPLLLESSVK
jgi:hypothetical protein